MTKRRSAAAVRHRRRGSVLVLVMTLLGVLFVTGVVFMAAMNFEAEMVGIQQRRDLKKVGVDAVVEQTEVLMRKGVTGFGGAPFGGVLDAPFGEGAPDGPPTNDPATSAVTVAELPGVHNWFSPIEPYCNDDKTRCWFRWFTDLPGLVDPLAALPQGVKIDVTLASGVLSRPNLPLQVDADGDGVTDTFQFDLSDLGFPPSIIAELSRQVNPGGDPSGRVFLGMRVLAHGGMVNLNESHPNLIANALGVNPTALRVCPAKLPDPNYGWLLHRPTAGWLCDDVDPAKYSPSLEEPMLRRRLLLPPQTIGLSLLHGNRLLDPQASGQSFGQADMPTKLYPPIDVGVFESVFDGDHRSLPFDTFFEPYNPDAPDSPSLWAVRMEPDTSSPPIDPTGNAYDSRHLLTTISYDDLLSRGGLVERYDKDGKLVRDKDGNVVEDDLRRRMIEINRASYEVGTCPGVLPFEYADYPQTIPNTGCDCPTDPKCRLNARKGRLQLSLAWLDEAFPCESFTTEPDRGNCLAQRARLIYDTFFMLVRNARGAYWDEFDCEVNPGICVDIGEQCRLRDDRQLCHDPVTGQTHRTARISRAAASLTANMIDYMDKDDVPTRIALRSFDFSDEATVGRTFGPPAMPDKPVQYVYGLERQPYITEVATVAEGDPPVLTAWGVELYNPYDADIANVFGRDDYYLVLADKDAGLSPVDLPPIGGIRLNDRIVANAGSFTVLLNGADAGFSVAPPQGDTRIRRNIDGLEKFRNGWIIYLVRRVQFPGDRDATNIVVDQFTAGGPSTCIGLEGNDLIDCVGGPNEAMRYVSSLQRILPDQTVDTAPSRWTCTVPEAIEVGAASLGTWNTVTNPTARPVRPVDVNFANTGSFTRFDPADDSRNPQRGVAFPTTGSMLLLMRHANRALTDFQVTTLTGAVDNPNLAFTSHLNETVRSDVTIEDPPGSGNFISFPGVVPQAEEIDNGRMPVFDTVMVDNGDPRVGRRFAHHLDPAETPTKQPGDASRLPWGQLLWDYFTALPLRSPGPYEPPPGVPAAEFDPGRPESQPRVDLDGLRVHGRININAAPWKVLAGLPMMPMQRVPQMFRARIRAGAGLVDPNAANPLDPTPDELIELDTQASVIGNALAQGVVAYRDTMNVSGSGDYDTDPPEPDVKKKFARGWNVDKPIVRRGTGFLTVGELANVRHFGAVPDPSDMTPPPDQVSYFRIDGGNLDGSSPDYVRAVGMLVALGDWITVRSDVFTIYGVLRGDVVLSIPDPIDRAIDVDKRAVRFQETVDRLPMFLGVSEPVRIGPRVVGPYVDVRND